MITEDHPYFFIEQIASDNKDAKFHLSKYKYTPDSLLDEREVLTVASGEFTQTWVDHQLSLLRNDQELALHSSVTIKNRTYHVPMIDFAFSTEPSPRVLDRIHALLFKSVFLTLNFYETGRSFHAYSTSLMTPSEWLEFMGRLLLVNPKGDRDAIVDTRWVGHRLISGYCSLRWSNNSGQYLRMPRLVGNPATLRAPSRARLQRVG